MRSLCVHYAVVMLWLGGAAPHWFIERSSRRWGADTPRRWGADTPPPSIRQSIYKLVPKQQRSDHFTLTYFICLVMRLNCSVFILGLNGGIDT